MISVSSENLSIIKPLVVGFIFTWLTIYGNNAFSTENTYRPSKISRCAQFLGQPKMIKTVIKDSLPKKALFSTEGFHFKGKQESIPDNKLADIVEGLNQTRSQLSDINLRLPEDVHVVLEPSAENSSSAPIQPLIRLREKRLIYLRNYDPRLEEFSGVQRLVANHELIHASLFSSFPLSARVNTSGFLQETFANFLSYHFDPVLYNKEGSSHPTSLEYKNESIFLGSPKGKRRTSLSSMYLSGNSHGDGVKLGFLLLQVRESIGEESMNNFLRDFIPSLNHFSLPKHINVKEELYGDSYSAQGQALKNSEDLLLALSLINKSSRSWNEITDILTEFTQLRDSNISIERLTEIENQLIPNN